MLWKTLGQTLLGGINSHLERRERRKERADKLEQAQTDSRIRILEADNQHAINMDMYMVQQSKTKRNVSFYAASAPIAMAFIPGLHDDIMQGFQTIEKMPEWYRYGVALMLVSVWGYRRLLRAVINRQINGVIKKANGYHK